MFIDLVTSRPSLDDAPSPSLSSSTHKSDKSEVDLYRKGPSSKGANGKKVPFGFSMAMEVRPVRSSTSSKNQENQEWLKNKIVLEYFQVKFEKN